MNRRKVLIIGMLDSIHTFRWLSQFKDLSIDFLLFPSKKHKYIHEGLLGLLNSNHEATFSLATLNFGKRFHGYFDFLLFVLGSKIGRINSRIFFLNRVIQKSTFSYVHALEIQGAGYLLDAALKNRSYAFSTILTNWGSDIYFYKDKPEHKTKIESALRSADYYSAECARDYILAREMGFTGIDLPCIPNAGGFTRESQIDASKTSERRSIVAKTYGGEFGRGDLVIKGIGDAFERIDGFTAFLYSVTDDLLDEVEELSRRFYGRVSYSTRKNPLNQNEMSELFRRSRVYLGASRSDGISTSFLEALNYGCYPIQTDTSCAADWLKLGAIASIVPQESNLITVELMKSLSDDALVDKAQIANQEVSSNYLSYERIKRIASTFYGS
jgi:hypothetical protein